MRGRNRRSSFWHSRWCSKRESGMGSRGCWCTAQPGRDRRTSPATSSRDVPRVTRLLSWYGDDFTGSTDALEALASNGVRSILFLGQPDDEFVHQFEDCEAFGIAGVSRSQTPGWMDANLPPVFEWMRRLETPLCHYKV